MRLCSILGIMTVGDSTRRTVNHGSFTAQPRVEPIANVV